MLFSTWWRCRKSPRRMVVDWDAGDRAQDRRRARELERLRGGEQLGAPLGPGGRVPRRGAACAHGRARRRLRFVLITSVARMRPADPASGGCRGGTTVAPAGAWIVVGVHAAPKCATLLALLRERGRRIRGTRRSACAASATSRARARRGAARERRERQPGPVRSSGAVALGRGDRCSVRRASG